MIKVKESGTAKTDRPAAAEHHSCSQPPACPVESLAVLTAARGQHACLIFENALH
ncbi:hypothetical protein G3M53_65780 [Streptomyces sp. SID7982]|nr:hypothetical protein [Streptomyces sp. SID7982]